MITEYMKKEKKTYFSIRGRLDINKKLLVTFFFELELLNKLFPSSLLHFLFTFYKQGVPSLVRMKISPGS